MADSSKRKWFPWRRRSQALQTPRPESREVAAAQVTDKYSEYPSDGLTPVRLAEIFKEADAGDVLRQAELFEEMEEKDPHLFSQLQTRKNAVTGLDYEVIPFDSDDPRDKEIAEFVEAQLGGSVKHWACVPSLRNGREGTHQVYGRSESRCSALEIYPSA